MASILVHTAFTLTRSATERVPYGVGLHKNVPESDADHWYTLQHAAKLADGDEQAEAPPPAPMTDGKRDAIIDRILVLFRMHLAPLSDEKLVDMLADAEKHAVSAAERARDAGVEVQAEQPAEPEEVEAEAEVDKKSPGDTPPEPVDERQQSEGGEAALTDVELVDAMKPEELRAFIETKTGKAPHHNLSDENLLKKAKEVAIAEAAKPAAPAPSAEEAI